MQRDLSEPILGTNMSSDEYIDIHEEKKDAPPPLEETKEQKAPEEHYTDNTGGAPKSQEQLKDEKGLRDAYSWDLCLVFKVGDEKKQVKLREKVPGKRTQKVIIEDQGIYFKRETSRMLAQLKKGGLHTFSYLSIQKDEIYILVGADEGRLRQEAQRLEWDMKLDDAECIRYGKEKGIPLAKATGGPLVAADAWRNLYGKYEWFDPPGSMEDPDPRARLYPKYNEGTNHPGTVFRQIDRIKLTNSIIECEEMLGGAGLKMRVAGGDENHPLIAYFPLDDLPRKAKLSAKWNHWKSLYLPPLEEIREYFGEQITIYFAFLSFYSRWLFWPAVLGWIFFIWQRAAGHVDVDGIAAYAIIMGIWSTFMLEQWKRRQSDLVAEWGMHKFLTKETPRPEFQGQWEISTVNGRYEEIFPFWEKVRRAVLSQTVIWTLIGVVLACVTGIFFFRGFLQTRMQESQGGTIASLVNAIQIQILNQLYGMVSHKLNDYENHRTDTEYENALIAKSFLFKFVNSYNSLFYIAFIKKHDKSLPSNLCYGTNSCLDELQQQLGIIFVTGLVVNNLVELLTPIISRALARRKENTEQMSWKELMKDDSISDKKKSPAEAQYEQSEYESTFSDWDEIVIQYGFLSLFIVAFPLAPFAALLSNWVENKLDARKLLKYVRRPMPRGAANIGMWYNILSLVSWISVITNTGIIVFETRQFDKFSLTTQWLIFVFAEHALLLAKGAIGYFVPDESEQTKTHLQRQDYLANVLIGGMEDKGEFEFGDVEEGKEGTV